MVIPCWTIGLPGTTMSTARVLPPLVTQPATTQPPAPTARSSAPTVQPPASTTRPPAPTPQSPPSSTTRSPAPQSSSPRQSAPAASAPVGAARSAAAPGTPVAAPAVRTPTRREQPPTAPPAVDVPPVARRLEPPPLPFEAVLGTILYSPDRKFAIVNGRIVGPGDEVNGARIVDITPTTVLLRDAQGRLRSLSLGGVGRNPTGP